MPSLGLTCHRGEQWLPEATVKMLVVISENLKERTESHVSCFLLALKCEVLRKGFSDYSIKLSRPLILCYLSS